MAYDIYRTMTAKGTLYGATEGDHPEKLPRDFKLHETKPGGPITVKDAEWELIASYPDDDRPRVGFDRNRARKDIASKGYHIFEVETIVREV